MPYRTNSSLDRRTFLRLAAGGLAGLAALHTRGAWAGEDAAIPPVRVPPDAGADEQWVAVNLTHQAAVGMVGEMPVRVALATTGMDGWETPEGIFRMVRRVYNETMTSASLGITDPNDQYVLKDVLFTQYFTTVGHALHLNYWRPDEVFGKVRTSHGWVGLRYDDAAFFWEFLGLGSRVVIHR